MIIKKKNRQSTEVNASSMADIAFLLLVFFLVTTTIASDKGIAVLLPPDEEPDEVKLKEKNIFNILVNSQNRLLVEGSPLYDINSLTEKVKEFVNNNGTDPKSSESPQKAVVSLKTDRGTSYETYVGVYDDLKRAYHELRAEYLGISLEQYNSLDKKNPDQKAMYDRARKAYPIQISDAEPTDISGL